jgi:hypothetical protein
MSASALLTPRGVCIFLHGLSDSRIFAFRKQNGALQPFHLNVRLAGVLDRQTLFKRDFAFSCRFLHCRIK